MKKVLSILTICFMFALSFPATAPAPIVTQDPMPTECNVVVTECPEVVTECIEVPTECPEVITECIEVPTECPEVITECIEVPTECPKVVTECIEVPTECPKVVTECIEIPTECPVEPTLCPEKDCEGGEGCTPGYWKQEHHFDSWTAPYTPDTKFCDVFDCAPPLDMTLLEVLEQGGGKLIALGRHTVAALLNAASPDVSYDLSSAAVISMFNDAYPGDKDDYENLKNVFEGFNEQGCPLN
jgi:hypothetical protein